MKLVDILKQFEKVKIISGKDALTNQTLAGLEGLENSPLMEMLPAVSISELAERIKNYVLTSLDTKSKQDSELKILSKTIDNRLSPTPILVFGRPGIGKSQIVAELAKYNIKVIDMRLAYYEPSDLLTTLPIKTGKGEKANIILEKAYGRMLLELCSEEAKKHLAVVLLLDELDKANPIILNVLLQLTLDRKYDELELPPNVFIIAVANFPEDNISISGVNLSMDISRNKALFDRFDAYIVGTSLSDWLRYAEANNFPEFVLSFLKQYPKYFYYVKNYESEDDSYVLVTPRRWEKVCRVFKKLESSIFERYDTLTVYILRKLLTISKLKLDTEMKTKLVAAVRSIMMYWYDGSIDEKEVVKNLQDYLNCIGYKGKIKTIEDISKLIEYPLKKGEGVKQDQYLVARTAEMLRYEVGIEFLTYAKVSFAIITYLNKAFNEAKNKFKEALAEGNTSKIENVLKKLSDNLVEYRNKSNVSVVAFEPCLLDYYTSKFEQIQIKLDKNGEVIVDIKPVIFELLYLYYLTKVNEVSVKEFINKLSDKFVIVFVKKYLQAKGYNDDVKNLNENSINDLINLAEEIVNKIESFCASSSGKSRLSELEELENFLDDLTEKFEGEEDADIDEILKTLNEGEETKSLSKYEQTIKILKKIDNFSLLIVYHLLKVFIMRYKSDKEEIIKDIIFNDENVIKSISKILEIKVKNKKKKK